MPALGESVTEGTVTRWLKAEGDTVEVDEPLLEVSTDKVDTEIPSPVAGVVSKILVQEDEVVPVGGELAVIGGESSGERRLGWRLGRAAPEASEAEAPEALRRPRRRLPRRLRPSRPPSRRRRAEKAPTGGTAQESPRAG